MWLWFASLMLGRCLQIHSASWSLAGLLVCAITRCCCSASTALILTGIQPCTCSERRRDIAATGRANKHPGPGFLNDNRPVFLLGRETQTIWARRAHPARTAACGIQVKPAPSPAPRFSNLKKFILFHGTESRLPAETWEAHDDLLYI